MSRNGSDLYSKPVGTTAVSGAAISSAKYNELLDDIAADLNLPRPIVAGGSGGATPAAARTNLGVAIGTDVQGFDAGLASFAGLTTAADKGIYSTGPDVFATFDLGPLSRTFLANTTAAGYRSTLGLGGLATLNILDEDDFVSDSAARPPSQQSTKAYLSARLSPSYAPSDQTVSLSSKLTLAHGIGAVPSRMQVQLKCATADAPYIVGEVLDAPTSAQVGGVEYGVNTSATSTSLNIRTGSAISVLTDAGAAKNLNVANWVYVIKAWAN